MKTLSKEGIEKLKKIAKKYGWEFEIRKDDKTPMLIRDDPWERISLYRYNHENDEYRLQVVYFGDIGRIKIKDFEDEDKAIERVKDIMDFIAYGVKRGVIE